MFVLFRFRRAMSLLPLAERNFALARPSRTLDRRGLSPMACASGALVSRRFGLASHGARSSPHTARTSSPSPRSFLA